MAWELRIDHRVKTEMLDCSDEDRKHIEEFVLALQTNAYPAHSQELSPLCFFAELECGYYVSWEAILDPAQPPSVRKPHLSAVRVLKVGRTQPRRRNFLGGRAKL